MKECAWRKGCWQAAYEGEKFCYYHLKRREPPEHGGGRDLFASDSLEIGRAMRLLRIHKLYAEQNPTRRARGRPDRPQQG